MTCTCGVNVHGLRCDTIQLVSNNERWGIDFPRQDMRARVPLCTLPDGSLDPQPFQVMLTCCHRFNPGAMSDSCTRLVLAMEIISFQLALTALCLQILASCLIIASFGKNCTSTQSNSMISSLFFIWLRSIQAYHQNRHIQLVYLLLCLELIVCCTGR